ncbi:hypothetical protein C8R47DRAFT_770561 [Mycena vitilis]|nr:hypothetical protein C8R47DRAFT_770561 [Mycena vitilis]
MVSSRLRENISDGGSWKSYEHNVSTINSPMEPLLDDQPSETPESPVFGPREQGLFQTEIPYDRDSPLSQLASGWKSLRYTPRPLPELPISDPQDTIPGSEMAYDPSVHPDPPEAPLPRIASPALFPHRGSQSRHTSSSDAVDGTYYVIPKGMNVIFQDEDGNEITRVGDFKGRQRQASLDGAGHESDRATAKSHSDDSRRSDGLSSRRTRQNGELGYERHGPRTRSVELHRLHLSGSERSQRRSDLPTVILIDRSGRQIPM